MRPISIHHVAAIDLQPAEFVAVAAASGASHVSLFLQAMGNNPFPVLSADQVSTVKKALSDNGLKIANGELGMIFPDTDIEGWLPLLDRASDLSARGVVVLLADSDVARNCDRLGELASWAGSRELKLSIEMIALGQQWDNTGAVNQLIDQVAHENLYFGADLLHIVRAGDSLESLWSLPNGRVSYAQICDSHDGRAHKDYLSEAAQSRLVPGEGVFPCRQFAQELPSSALLEIEVPNPADDDPSARLAQMVVATRALLDATP